MSGNVAVMAGFCVALAILFRMFEHVTERRFEWRHPVREFGWIVGMAAGAFLIGSIGLAVNLAYYGGNFLQ